MSTRPRVRPNEAVFVLFLKEPEGVGAAFRADGHAAGRLAPGGVAHADQSWFATSVSREPGQGVQSPTLMKSRLGLPARRSGRPGAPTHSTLGPASRPVAWPAALHCVTSNLRPTTPKNKAARSANMAELYWRRFLYEGIAMKTHSSWVKRDHARSASPHAPATFAQPKLAQSGWPKTSTVPASSTTRSRHSSSRRRVASRGGQGAIGTEAASSWMGRN